MYIKMYVADVLLLAPPTNKLIHSGRTVNKVGKVTKLGEWICYSSNGRRGREQSFWRNIYLDKVYYRIFEEKRAIGEIFISVKVYLLKVMVISKRCNVHRHFFENSSLDKRNINRLRGRLNIVKQKHNGGSGCGCRCPSWP